jgi:acyl-CoA thioester hydrolase
MMSVAPQTPAVDTATVEGGHVESVPVHYDDLDAMGIVHNARYAVLLERALNAFWTPLGYTFDGGVFSKPDVFLAVAEFAIVYRTPFRGTGTLDVRFWVDRLGETSAAYGFRMVSTDGATVHAEGRRVHIRLDQATMRPAAWTPACRDILQGLRRGE